MSQISVEKYVSHVFQYNFYLVMLEVNGNTYPMTIDKQGYHPKFLQCGMEVYREYQRRLWDPNCETEFPGDEA